MRETGAVRYGGFARRRQALGLKWARGMHRAVATPKDILNELRWRHDALDEAEVWFLHRGAPNDTRIVPGTKIRDLHHSFMELEGPEGGTMIPYHRVQRILRDGRPIWIRRPRTFPGGEE